MANSIQTLNSGSVRLIVPRVAEQQELFNDQYLRPIELQTLTSGTITVASSSAAYGMAYSVCGIGGRWAFIPFSGAISVTAGTGSFKGIWMADGAVMNPWIAHRDHNGFTFTTDQTGVSVTILECASQQINAGLSGSAL